MVIAEIHAWWQILIAFGLSYALFWTVTLIARAHDERRANFIYAALILLPLVVIGLVAIA